MMVEPELESQGFRRTDCVPILNCGVEEENNQLGSPIDIENNQQRQRCYGTVEPESQGFGRTGYVPVPYCGVEEGNIPQLQDCILVV